MDKKASASKFMGRTYAIEYHPHDSLKNDEGQPVWGDTDHEKQLIRIESDLPHDKERAIILHEVYHQFFSLLNITIPEDLEEQYRELAERVSRACVFDQGCAELDRREAVVYHNLNDE